MLAHGDERLVQLGVEIVEFDGMRTTVFLFLDEDEVHEAHDAARRQIHELGHNLARELVALESDQGILQGKV